MKHKTVPLWIYNGYLKSTSDIETRIKELRAAGLHGLILENVAILESLKNTAKNLETQYTINKDN